MRYRKGLIFICLIICLFSIACVCASDVNETVVASDNQIDEIIGIDNDDIVTCDNQVNEGNLSADSKDVDEVGVTEENELSSTNGTFKDLANDIANADDELNLTKDYIYSSSDSSYKYGITINKRITINGNGFIINGNNQAKAFRISSNNVVLKDILFIKCLATNGNGGAVEWPGSDGVLGNCSFVNCSVSFSFSSSSSYACGGAVYWNGSDGVLGNCSFVNCSASFSSSYACGGAVYWNGVNGSVSVCSFMYNSVNTYGSAIYWNGTDGNVFNCSFMNNSGIAGDIYWNKCNNGTIFECSFVNCSNIAIYLNDMNGAVYGCSFVNCSGQAIGWYGDYGKIFNCSFVNCSGQAIGWYGDYGKIFNCSFVNCFVGFSGGAIRWQGDNGTVYGCSFVNCSTNGIYPMFRNGGGAIDWGGDNGAVYGCSFVNCSSYYGGAVYGSAVYGCSFVNCSAYSGGAVNTEYISNCTFVDCHADFGGAISRDGLHATVSDCSFENCSAKYSGGAIMWNINEGVVSNCSFTDCSANSAGAIYWNVDWSQVLNYKNGAVANCSFVNCSAKENGGAIEWSDKNGSTFNCSFVNCSAEYGGAIYVESDGLYGVLSNCNFMNCSAKSSGGAIEWSSDNGIISNCSFVNCYVDKKYDDKGGAIYWWGDNGVVSECSFVNCSASYCGGAIDWGSDIRRCEITGTISNCSFVNCSAEYGGAIYWDNYAGGVVFACSFINNTANEGIIYFYNILSNNLIIKNNIFLNHPNGCEISFYQMDHASNIGYNWFGNTATNNNQPIFKNFNPSIWLFLNVEINRNAIPIFGSFEIIFKLYAYNKTSQRIFEYDNSLLKPVNLTITSTNGDLNKNVVKIMEPIKYTATNSEVGSVTASIENIVYTIELKNLKNPELYVEPLKTNYSKNIFITFNYNANAKGKVNIILKGKKYTKIYKNLDLNTKIALLDVSVDEYDVNVIYFGDDNFSNATANTKIIVYKTQTQLTASAITATYNFNKNLVITLKDTLKNPIIGVQVSINLDGVKYLTTDNYGQIKLSTKNIKPAVYNARISFAGNTNYIASTKYVKVTVTKATAKLTAAKKTFKKSVKTKKYTITLKTNWNKVMKGAKVTLKVKGKTYTATTNVKGQATFKIKNLKKKGKFAATVKFAGNAYYNAATKKVKIIVK